MRNIIMILSFFITVLLLTFSMIVGGGYILSALFSLALWKGMTIWLVFLTIDTIFLFLLAVEDSYESES